MAKHLDSHCMRPDVGFGHSTCVKARCPWVTLLLRLLLLVGVGLGMLPHRVYAQDDGDVHVQQLRVQVMPEFDDPRVLVIVQGRLATDDVALPVSLTVRLPRGAQINQMAEMDMSTGATISKAYDAVPDPEDDRWTLVTYELENAHLFYEFYYDPIEGSPDKSFSYVFSTLYAVDDLLLEVQQPRAATAFSLEPPATVARFDEKLELTYHQFTLGTLPAQGETAVLVSYTKTDPEPSISREQLMAMQMGSGVSEDVDVNTGAVPEPASLPTWLLVLVGGVILLGVGRYVWIRQSGGRTVSRGTRLPVPPSSPPEEPQASPPAQAQSSQGGFCTQCGTALKPGARFCHFCGAQRES